MLDSAGVSFDYVKEITVESYAPLIERADGLVIRTQPLTKSIIDRAERLQIVSRHGVGFDAVEVAALNERRIPLCIVGDVNSVSVAEQAMMLILGCAKRARRAHHAVSADWNWRNRMEAGEISGKRLLILGYGRAGRHLARMAAGFGMTVAAYDPPLARAGWPEGAVMRVDDLKAGLAAADVVSVHMPKGDGAVIGAAELAAMKPSAILVNTARGGIVDESALLDALQSGRLAAAGLDVFEQEPPDPDHPLFKLDQVITSPHIAGLTAESAERMAISSVQNVLDFFAGRLDPALIVNRNFGR